MRVCFIGHRAISHAEDVMRLLKETVVNLIDKGATTFLFGSMSAFNALSWQVVTELKEKYPYMKRVYVRSAHPYISKAYETYLLTSYEETYFTKKVERAGKSSYVQRNAEMIDTSSYCVFYYNENYTPSKGNSGTKIAYEYAKKKKKDIINLYT